ncbi:unnamed protein product, partial [Laminaria digitata]
GLEYVLGVPGQDVLSAWWSQSEGVATFAILFFGSGFVVFALLFSTWAIAWMQIMRGRPVSYVFLGPSLRSDKDYYFALDDRSGYRLEITKRTGGYDYNPSSSLSSLYSIHTMLRYGPEPEDAERALAHNTRSQVLLVAFQYAALLFGLIALRQIVVEYVEIQGVSIARTDLVQSTAVSLLPLLMLQVFGLMSGHVVLGRKVKPFDDVEYTKTHEPGLRPDDKVLARLTERGRRRLSSGNKPFASYYRVEWRPNGTQPVSAVFAFRATWKIRSAIEELDRMTDRGEQLHCVVSEDFKLQPVSLSQHGNVDWI